MSESEVSSSESSVSNKHKSLVKHKSIGIQTDENEQVFLCRNSSHCSHFEDKENFLWFVCPVCTQAFSRYESKLVEHKQKVHGICNKNRTAFILSQTDLNPNVCMDRSFPVVPNFLLNVKNDLKVDLSVSPHANQKLDPYLKPPASFSNCNQLGKIDVEDMPTDAFLVLYGCDGNKTRAPSASVSSNVVEDVDIKPGNSIIGTEKCNDIRNQFLKDDYLNQNADQNQSDTELNSPEFLPSVNMDEIDSLNELLRLNLPTGRSQSCSQRKKSCSQEVFSLENHWRPTLKWSKKKPVKTKPHLRFIPRTIRNGISIYECRFCNTSFKDDKEWTSHQIIGHKNDEKPFHCKVCSSSFVSNSRRNRHYHQVHRSKQFDCSQCQKKLRNESQYKLHINSHIMTFEAGLTDNNSKIEKPFVCDICEKKFVTEFQLQEHSNIHSSNKPYQCTDCGKRYSTRGALSSHKTLHNPKYANASTECNICGKKLTSFKTLRTHIRIVHETKPGSFLCPTCGKDFKNSGSFKKHYDTIHLGKLAPRRYTCKDCGYKSESPALLKIHLVKHATERLFVCEICTKSFKGAIALKNHKKGHTGERKRFVCPTCGQRFTLRAVLENHQLLSHPMGDVEYKFSCKICGKKYAIERYLAAHEIRHDLSAMKHSCHICGKRFLEARSLRAHLEVHNRGGIVRNRKFILKMVSSINDEPDKATGGDEPNLEVSAEVKTPDIDNEEQAE